MLVYFKLQGCRFSLNIERRFWGPVNTLFLHSGEFFMHFYPSRHGTSVWNPKDVGHFRWTDVKCCWEWISGWRLFFHIVWTLTLWSHDYISLFYIKMTLALDIWKALYFAYLKPRKYQCHLSQVFYMKLSRHWILVTWCRNLNSTKYQCLNNVCVQQV